MTWKSYDFECQTCSQVFADLVQGVEGLPDECPACGASEGFCKQISAPALMSTIVPSYPGAKRLKAGYQHTHNRAAQKKDRQVSMAGTGGLKTNGS